ncbi:MULTISPECIES: hypothetical protein [Mycobacterium]|uniref:Uncharacterized protein n=1 Tax=Mycobacterium colombiense TaxID=339268 RepID=A0A329LUS4_9MYCO|nr:MULTISPECIES: hypothetical protein [Mycobacterium]MDM4141384.1 hypothetical protein [Mycobacterium sp. FLAC0960]RAV11198.1 hypothetical protein DQP57_12035 [Mycobacterium colombiense]
MMQREPRHSWVKFDDERGFNDEPAFVDLDEAARRMSLSKSAVMELVRIHALRYTVAAGELLVEPAILHGAVTTPSK